MHVAAVCIVCDSCLSSNVVVCRKIVQFGANLHQQGYRRKRKGDLAPENTKPLHKTAEGTLDSYPGGGEVKSRMKGSQLQSVASVRVAVSATYVEVCEKYVRCVR